jgi:anti-sigma factor RsiW
MNCPLEIQQSAEILIDYTARRLDAARTALLERHMQSCPACARFRREQAVVWVALDAWEPSPVSSDFNRRLWQRIEALDTAPWYERVSDFFRFNPWRPVFPLAAVFLVLIAGFLLDHRLSNKTPVANGPASSVSIIEADQVEQTLDDIQLLRQFDAAAEPSGGGPRQM